MESVRIGQNIYNIIIKFILITYRVRVGLGLGVFADVYYGISSSYYYYTVQRY